MNQRSDLANISKGSNELKKLPYSIKNLEVLGLLASLALLIIGGYRNQVFLFGIPILVSLYFIAKDLTQVSKLLILLPLGGLLLLGTRLGTGFGTIHILRDYAYFSSPIFAFAMGYVLYRHFSLEKFMLLLVLLGTLYSLIYLLQITFRFDTLFVDDAEKTRYFVGTGMPYPVLAWVFIILGYQYLKPFRISLAYWGLFLIINAIAIIYFASRVYYFTLVLYFLPLLYVYFVQRYKRMGKILFYIVSICLLILIVLLLQGEGFVAEKLRRSITEMFIQSFESYEDVIHNWRAYELYEAIKAFMNGSVLNKIFGYGFGKTVYLEYEMIMPLLTMSEIPIFHNGFAYLLVKTGLVGVCMELVFSFLILYKGYQYCKLKPTMTFEFSLLFSSVLSFNFSLLVVNGMFSGESAILMILTAFIFSHLRKEANKTYTT